MNANHEDRIRRLEALAARLESGRWTRPWLFLPGGPLQGVFFPEHDTNIVGVRDDLLPDIQDVPRLVRDAGRYPRLTLLPEGSQTDYGLLLFKDQLSLGGTPSTGTQFFVYAADGTTPLSIYSGRCDLKLRGGSLTRGASADFTIDDSGHIITTTVRGSTSGEPGESDFTDFYLAWAFVRV